MKKKLAALAVMCVILIVLGGINTNVFFGTQYLTTKPGFGYTVSSGVTWWDCNWSYNKKITIDHTKVQSDQDYFPVLLYESSDADLVAHAQSDGDDILFVDAGQTVQLHHEIEKYNSATGEFSIWVEVAHLLSTSDTVIYMYYGNPDCSSQQNIVGTWNSNFAMVQHLNETSGVHTDSTSNNNNGTVVGGVTQGTSGRSVLDGSDQFNGDVDQYVSFGNQTSLTPSSVTVEAWVKDPPKQNLAAVHILNKQQEQKNVLPNALFSVERTITVDSPTDVVFVTLCSPGVILKDMSVDGVSVFSGLYGAKKPTSSEEQRVENIRTKLPDEVQDLSVLAYSKPFHVEDQTSVVMQFQSSGLNTMFSQGRISYLVLSQDNKYDVECTTHWYSDYNFIFSNSNEVYSRAADSLLKNEKSTLVSTTNFIYTDPCFFNFLYLPCFNSLPSVISSFSLVVCDMTHDFIIKVYSHHYIKFPIWKLV